jgi:hypothetical protein
LRFGDRSFILSHLVYHFVLPNLLVSAFSSAQTFVPWVLQSAETNKNSPQLIAGSALKISR